ncbi:MAG: hypothetical protein O9264_08760 [Leptospira sp.]|nr:hypothetical protein [Leptospira sp.]
MNKVVMEGAKLGTSGLLSLLLTRAISKANSVQKMWADRYPGLAPAVASSAIAAASFKFGKSIKDQSIRTGIQAGASIASGIAILNVEKIRNNLPPSVQGLLAGDQPSNHVTVGADELQQIVQAEADRISKKALRDAGFEVGNESSQRSIPEQTNDSVTEEFVNGDEIYFTSGEEEIYSDIV